MLSLTFAVLFDATGTASAAHGLAIGEAGHQSMEKHGDGQPGAASLAVCCDATGTTSGGCLVDAVFGHPIAAKSGSSLRTDFTAAETILQSVSFTVPTGPPKV